MRSVCLLACAAAALSATAELRDFWTYETSEWGQGEYVPDPRVEK